MPDIWVTRFVLVDCLALQLASFAWDLPFWHIYTWKSLSPNEATANMRVSDLSKEMRIYFLELITAFPVLLSGN